MNNNFKLRILTGVALFGAMFFAASCNDDWDDHYDDKGMLNPNETLLDVIKAQDSNLHDFYEVVDACGCVDSLFNQTRVYTLWAPKDGTFNKDSLLAEIEAGRRDYVLERFVKAHMTNYLHPANGVLSDDNDILLLNDKVVCFSGDATGYTFNDIPLSSTDGEYNIRVRNGLLHKLNSAVSYKLNIWEYLDTLHVQDERISHMAKYLYSHNVREFVPELAIVGPTINGEVTYLDSASAFVNSNFWFSEYTYDKKTNGFGAIDVEDSTFTMFAITNDVWDRMVEKTTKYYNFRYDNDITETEQEYYDSLQYHYARKMLCNHLVFNNNEQKDEKIVHPDSMMSNFRYYGSGYKVVRRKFAKNELMDGVIDSKELSNGTIYIKDNYNFKDADIWHDTIKVEAENTDGFDYTTISTLVSNRYVSKLTKNEDIVGDISGSYYLQVSPREASAVPEVEFTIPNTLSATYRVRLVFVPANITSKYMDIETLKPTRLSVAIYEGNNPTPIYQTEQKYGLTTDPTRIDSVYLYDVAKDKENAHDTALRKDYPAEITFSHCEYGYTTDETTVKLQLKFDQDLFYEIISGSPDPTLDRSFRLDCIILEPVVDDELE